MKALKTIFKPGEIVSSSITGEFGSLFPGDVKLFYNDLPITHYDVNTLSLGMGRIEDLNPNYFLGRFYGLANFHLDFVENQLHYWRDQNFEARIQHLCMQNGWHKN